MLHTFQRRSYAAASFHIRSAPTTTASAIKSIQDNGKFDLYKYELRGSRRNNYDRSRALKDIQESNSKTQNLKLHTEERDFVKQICGYTDAELDRLQDFNTFDSFLFDKTTGEPIFQNFVEEFGQSKSMTDLLNGLKKRHENISAVFRSETDTEEKKELISSGRIFEQYQAKISKKAVDQTKRQVKQFLDEYCVPIKVSDIIEAFNIQYERSDNELLDELGQMKQAVLDDPTKHVARIGRYFQRDEFGCLEWSHHTLEFYEEMFPEVRDIGLKEMNAQIWRVDFKPENKKYLRGLDDMVQMTHTHFRNQDREKNDIQLGVSSGADAKAREMEQLLQSVNKTLDELAAVAREVSSLQTLIESAQSTRAAAVEDDEQGEEHTKAVNTEASEKWWKMMEGKLNMTRQQMLGRTKTRDVTPVDPLTYVAPEEEGKK